ncbi:MAG: hypothetical protein ACI9Y7_002046 [Dokdonia sp.]|jgi:hypothetical protein
MKNLFILIFFISCSAFSQDLKQVDSLTFENTGYLNGFLVKELEGQKASDIYAKVKKWSQYNIRRASWAVHSDVENEYIAFNVRDVDVIFSHRAFGKDLYPWNMNLNIEIRIKDNKVRLDVARIDFKCNKDNCDDLQIASSRGLLVTSIYNRKGKVRNKYYVKIKSDAETKLNSFCKELLANLDSNSVDYKKGDW